MAGEISNSLDFMEEVVDGFLDELDFLDDIVRPDHDQAKTVPPEVPEKPPEVLVPVTQMPSNSPQDLPFSCSSTKHCNSGENLSAVSAVDVVDLAKSVLVALAQMQSSKQSTGVKENNPSKKHPIVDKEIKKAQMNTVHSSDSLEPGECSDSSQERKRKRAKRFGLELHKPKSKIEYSKQISYTKNDRDSFDGEIVSSSPASCSSITPHYSNARSYPSYQYSEGQRHSHPSHEHYERHKLPYDAPVNPIQIGKHVTKMHGDDIQLFTRKKIKQHCRHLKVSLPRRRSNSYEEISSSDDNKSISTLQLSVTGEDKEKRTESTNKRKRDRRAFVKNVEKRKICYIDLADSSESTVTQKMQKEHCDVDTNITPTSKMRKNQSRPISDVDNEIVDKKRLRKESKQRKRHRRRLRLAAAKASVTADNIPDESELAEFKQSLIPKSRYSIQHSISTDTSSLYEVFDIASPLTKIHSHSSTYQASPTYQEPCDIFPRITSENETEVNGRATSPVSVCSLETLHRSPSPGFISDQIEDMNLESPIDGSIKGISQSFVVLSTAVDEGTQSPLHARNKSSSPVVDSSTSPFIERRSRRPSLLSTNSNTALIVAENGFRTDPNTLLNSNSHDDESGSSWQFVTSVSRKVPTEGSEISLSLSVSTNKSTFSEKSVAIAIQSSSKQDSSRLTGRKRALRSVSSCRSLKDRQSPSYLYRSSRSRSRSGPGPKAESSSQRLKSYRPKRSRDLSSSSANQPVSVVSHCQRSREQRSVSHSESESPTRTRKSGSYSGDKRSRSSPFRNQRSSSPNVRLLHSSRKLRSSSHSANLSTSPSGNVGYSFMSRSQRSLSPCVRVSSFPGNMTSEPPLRTASTSPSSDCRSTFSKLRKSSSPSRNGRPSSPSGNRAPRSRSQIRRSGSRSRIPRSRACSRNTRSSSPSRSRTQIRRSGSRSRIHVSRACSSNSRSRSPSRSRRPRSLSKTQFYWEDYYELRRPSFMKRRHRSVNRSKSPQRSETRKRPTSKGRRVSPRRYRRSTSRSRRRSRSISPRYRSQHTLKKHSLLREKTLNLPVQSEIAKELFSKSDGISLLSTQPPPVAAQAVNLPAVAVQALNPTDLNTSTLLPHAPVTSIPSNPYYSVNDRESNYFAHGQPDIPGVGAYRPTDTVGYAVTSTIQVSHHNVHYPPHQVHPQYYHPVYQHQYPPHRLPHFSAPMYHDIRYTRPNLLSVPNVDPVAPALHCTPNSSTAPPTTLTPNLEQKPSQVMKTNNSVKSNLVSVPMISTQISSPAGTGMYDSTRITVPGEVEGVSRSDNQDGTTVAQLSKLVCGDKKTESDQIQRSEDPSFTNCNNAFETTALIKKGTADRKKITINLLCNATKKTPNLNISNTNVFDRASKSDAPKLRHFASEPTVTVLKSNVCSYPEGSANTSGNRQLRSNNEVTFYEEVEQQKVDSVIQGCSGFSINNSVPHAVGDKNNICKVDNPITATSIDGLLKLLQNVLCGAKSTVSTQVNWTGDTFLGTSNVIESPENGQNVELFHEVAKRLKNIERKCDNSQHS